MAVSVVAWCPGSSFSFPWVFTSEKGTRVIDCRIAECGFTLPFKSSRPGLGGEKTKRKEEYTCLDSGDRLTTLCMYYTYICLGGPLHVRVFG